MGLSLRRKWELIDIVTKLMKYKIASIFCDPVDPWLDHCPDYFQVIKKPMALKIVLTNLQADEYSSYTEFHEDMKLIWQNAIDYNGPQSLITLMALQLRTWFNEMTLFMSDKTSEDWISKFKWLQVKVVECIERDVSEPPIETRESTSFNQNESSGGVSRKGKAKKMSQADLDRLMEKILGLEEEHHILELIAVIRENEPELGITEDSEFNILELSVSTRYALLEYLDNINEDS
jgi:hypothetical protein